MEIEQRTTPPLLGMCACDAELFRRVWERVAPESQENSLIVPVPAPSPAPASPPAEEPQENTVPEPAPSCPVPEVMPTVQEVPETPEMPETPAVPAPPESILNDDFPGDDALPCLGTASSPHGGQLQQYIQEELDGWQLYRHLAKRVTGPAARTLASLASEKHRCARRLAAAYFLISGVRFWPTDRLETPRLNAWMGVLRKRFSEEQRLEHSYRAAACGTSDPCLIELYQDLAAACAAHADVLRMILESTL